MIQSSPPTNRHPEDSDFAPSTVGLITPQWRMCPGCVAVVNSLHVDENLDKGRGERERGRRKEEGGKEEREKGSGPHLLHH